MATKRTRETDNAAATLHCAVCGKKFNNQGFYNSKSKLYSFFGNVAWCKDCIDSIYLEYEDKYKKLGYADPSKKAVERMCMFLDLYYSDKAYESAVKQIENGNSTATPISLYVKIVSLYQYKSKNYDTTLQERYNEDKRSDKVMSIYSQQDSKNNKAIDKARKLFGAGFDDADYVYLNDQYEDWTSRHECNTKAQEEVFKNICLTQLQLHKATIAKEDTKDLAVQLQRWLDTGKLQPKQNAGDTTADNQTFGTLIDKWENTRPIPEPEDDLKDVDKIGLYIDVFFRGHLAKMMGLKNGFSNLYTKFMQKYTVEKPEYDDDEDNEALFDAIFGGTVDDDE